jgi:hypothetical protein
MVLSSSTWTIYTIFHCHLHMIHISQSIQYTRACSTCDQFLNWGRLLTSKLMLIWFSNVPFKVCSSMLDITINFVITTFHRVICCCLTCFLLLVKSFLTHWYRLRTTSFVWSNYWAYGGWNRSTLAAYSTFAANSNSGIFRGPR